MAPKRATFITNGADSICQEARKFIEDSGVLLTIRDIEKKPFSYLELKRMIGYKNLDHFLNQMAPGYSKNKIGDILDDRDEVLKAIAEDNSILRFPIIQTSRLMTIGCNKKMISEMLQISSNGSNPSSDEPRGNIQSSKFVTRRTVVSKTSSSSEEATPKAN